jgi:hypothetical protein
MGASFILRYDYAEEIKSHNFKHVAALIRKGDISALDQTELDLLSDFLEGKLKRPKGAPKRDAYELAEYLYDEYLSLRNFGLTSREFSNYHQKHATPENYKELFHILRKSGMNRQQAIEALASEKGMGCKNVERLIDLGRKISDQRAEEMHRLEHGDSDE